MPRRKARLGRAAFGLLSVTTLTFGVAVPVGADNGPSPGQPRVKPLKPRVVPLQPRVISIAPAQPAPNNFTVNSDVLFAFGSANLSPEAQGVLGNVVNQLKGLHAGTIAITGYTDSVGDPNYNQQLSQNRANSVQGFLQQAVGNSSLTYQSSGQGEANPVQPNKTPDGKDNPVGRAANRRVTIAYTPAGQKPATPTPSAPPSGGSGSSGSGQGSPPSTSPPSSGAGPSSGSGG